MSPDSNNLKAENTITDNVYKVICGKFTLFLYTSILQCDIIEVYV